jgi:hypothetical protein
MTISDRPLVRSIRSVSFTRCNALITNYTDFTTLRLAMGLFLGGAVLSRSAPAPENPTDDTRDRSALLRAR